MDAAGVKPRGAGEETPQTVAGSDATIATTSSRFREEWCPPETSPTLQHEALAASQGQASSMFGQASTFLGISRADAVGPQLRAATESLATNTNTNSVRSQSCPILVKVIMPAPARAMKSSVASKPAAAPESLAVAVRPAAAPKTAAHAAKVVKTLGKGKRGVLVRTLRDALSRFGRPRIWEKHYSAQWQTWYWWHIGTGASQWTRPKDLSS